MEMKHRVTELFSVALLLSLLLLPARTYAHCDTMEGPVVKTARVALKNGDVTPLLKWVRAENEAEIRQAFEKTMAVRVKGPEAKELADMYFFETLVRIHRAGEDAPYTGLKPGAAVDPAVALADKALESGSVDELVSVLTKAMDSGIRERFAHARETKPHAEESVTAGRKFVESYIVFTHYIEGLHSMIKGSGAHHGPGAGEMEAHAHGHE